MKITKLFLKTTGFIFIFLVSLYGKAQTISTQLAPTQNQPIASSTALNQPDEAVASMAKSKYFARRLSSQECTANVAEVLRINAPRSQHAQLDILLDALLVECGIKSSETPIQFAPVAYQFEGSNLLIFWDGNSITLNEQAQSTIDYTMPPSFKNIVVVRKNDIIENKKTGFYDWLKKGLASVYDNLELVEHEGETHLMLTGYAYHDRGTYPHFRTLNEAAFGIGIERAVINKNGNREAVSAMVFLDSHSDPEFTVSYEVAKPMQISQNITGWVGVSAGLTSRSDIAERIPVPFVFPTVGLSVGKLSIRTVIIPKLGPANGNVIFVFGSYALSK